MNERTIVTNLRNLDHIQMDHKKPYLIFISGPSVGQVYMLEEKENVVGRGKDASIVVEDDSISRRHVQFSVDGQFVEVHDLDSTNGTFVNGRRVKQCMLEESDRIQISSNTIMKFSYQDKVENIFHKEIYRMAVTDPLTSIYNKRFFLERINEEFSYANRGKQSLSLIIFDVDHFKTFNDTYGHLAGDFVLQHLAGVVSKMTRAGDIFARYGGEEFALILRQADLAPARALAERIRVAVEKDRFEHDGHVFNVTISLGVATYSPNCPNARALIQEADRCLYQAKAAGRNRVCPTQTTGA